MRLNSGWGRVWRKVRQSALRWDPCSFSALWKHLHLNLPKWFNIHPSCVFYFISDYFFKCKGPRNPENGACWLAGGHQCKFCVHFHTVLLIVHNISLYIYAEHVTRVLLDLIQIMSLTVSFVYRLWRPAWLLTQRKPFLAWVKPTCRIQMPSSYAFRVSFHSFIKICVLSLFLANTVNISLSLVLFLSFRWLGRCRA